MNYCETCAFWKLEKYPTINARNVCSCQKLCECSEEEAFADDALTYSYDESGSFYPGPKFGCVHHKEKE